MKVYVNLYCVNYQWRCFNNGIYVFVLELANVFVPGSQHISPTLTTSYSRVNILISARSYWLIELWCVVCDVFRSLEYNLIKRRIY